MEFKEISNIVKNIGYIFELEFQYTPSIKTLFLKGGDHTTWSHHPLSHYAKTRGYTKTSLVRFRILAKSSKSIN